MGEQRGRRDVVRMAMDRYDSELAGGTREIMGEFYDYEV